MQSTTLLNVSKPFESFKEKAEQHLYNLFPGQIDSGNFHTIHVGRNQDSSVGDRGGYRVRGNAGTMQQALFMDIPGRMLPTEKIQNEEAKHKTFETRASDSIKRLAVERVNALVDGGMSRKEAQSRVADSISKFGYFDAKTGTFVAEPIAARVNDSILGGLATPYWDISQVQKVFKQPMLRGYGDLLVSKVGVPNIWADLIQLFTESFEGFARVSNVARTNTEFNTSVAAKNRTGTMLSQVINLVIDYETPSPGHGIVGGMNGNWLTNATIGHRDAYANLMLEQLMTSLVYFGHAESGFDGLTQIANRDSTYDAYPDSKPPAQELWDDSSQQTVGADILMEFMRILGDKLEELYFLPTDIRVACAPILYKVLKFSMLSKVYNQNNPLSIIQTAFDAGNKIVGTMATRSGEQIERRFELIPDPMLAPSTPFNSTDEDLMFITFPSFQSSLDEGGLTDVVMMPTPIDKMILPSAPGFRDGVVRTGLKRVGSLLAPIEKSVHVITGMGTNNRYST